MEFVVTARGPLCCVFTMNAWPMNMRLQLPASVIIMGVWAAQGFMQVPDAMFIRYMPARFMCMCMCIMSWAAAVEANSSRAVSCMGNHDPDVFVTAQQQCVR